MQNNLMQRIDDLMIRGRKYGELIIASVLFLFFFLTRIFISSFMNLSIERWRFISPAFWPGWILVLGALLSAILVVNSYRNLKHAQACEQEEEKKESDCATDDSQVALLEKQQKEGKVLSLKELEILADAKLASGKEESTSKELVRLIGVVALVFVYLFLIRYMGFITSTLAFSFCYLLVLKERRPLILALAPIALVAIIYFIFTQLLVVPLPRGVGIFATLSNLFY